MKKRLYGFGLLFLITAYLLSACGTADLPDTVESGQIVVQAQSQDSTFEVAYTGVVEAINGSLWTINGVELTIDPSVIQDGTFIVGDTVKIEGNVSSDGSFIVSQVSSPTASDLTGLSVLGSLSDDDNDNNNTNENINSNLNTNFDDDLNNNTVSYDDNDNTNSNANSDDDDDNTNNNTNSDDDDSTNNNTNDDVVNGENTNGS